MAKLTPEEEQNLVEYSQIEAMTQSPGWKRFVEGLNRRITSIMRNIETADDSHLPRLAGELKGVRMARDGVEGYLTELRELRDKQAESEGPAE
jgi:hypothetical protein